MVLLCLYDIWYSNLLIGLLCKIYFINAPLIDPEVALPKLALEILNPFFLSIIFIGILSGSISTADSILVNCISNLYKDIFDFKKLEKNKVLLIGVGISITIFSCMFWIQKCFLFGKYVLGSTCKCIYTNNYFHI